MARSLLREIVSLRILILLAFFIAAPSARAQETLPPPPYPLAAAFHHDSGKLNLAVTFDPNGHATKCQVTSAEVSDKLAAYTIGFITSKWRSAKYAGEVVAVPVVFEPLDNFLPAPGYPAKAREFQEQGSMVLAVTFDAEGGVSACTVLKSNASDLLTRPTCVFIKKYWRGKIFAGRTETVPIDYHLGE